MNVIAPRAFRAPDLYRFTAAEVMALTEAGFLPEKRIELIDGVLFEMAAQLGPHARAMMELNRALISGGPDDLRFWPQVSMFFADDLILEPDLAITRGVIDTERARGADFELIIEVAVTSLEHDLKRKAPLYAAQGVPHYWVLEVPARRVHCHSAPVEGRYTATGVQAFSAPLTLPYVPHASLDLDILIPGETA